MTQRPKRASSVGPVGRNKGRPGNGGKARSSRPAPIPAIPAPGPGAWGRGGARLRSKILRQQLRLDRLEPVRTSRARPEARDSASQREAATHALRILAPPPPSPFVSGARSSRPPPRGPVLSPGDLFAMALWRKRNTLALGTRLSLRRSSRKA